MDFGWFDEPMTLLPFHRDDVVQWRGMLAIVDEVKGDRVVVRTDDEMVHITTQDRLRDMQAPMKRRGEVA